MLILDARDVTKMLGRRVVLRAASLTVQRGERVALLGENGSGKSTLLQIVGGVLSPDHGQLEIRGRLGFAPEKPDLPEHLLVGEWLDVVASLKRLKDVGNLPFGVAELSSTRASALSLGQRQRVSLASAWLGAPDLLVLDEPTNGLDAETQAELVARLSGLSALIATHDRAFADAVATRVVSVRAGALS